MSTTLDWLRVWALRVLSLDAERATGAVVDMVITGKRARCHPRVQALQRGGRARREGRAKKNGGGDFDGMRRVGDVRDSSMGTALGAIERGS